jgi:hypothetical protein
MNTTSPGLLVAVASRKAIRVPVAPKNSNR